MPFSLTLSQLFFIVLLSSLTGGAPGGVAEPPTSDAPSFLALRSYCAPTFVIDHISRTEGTGFLLERIKGTRRTYLFTAQHLFPAPSAELPARVGSASCASPETKRLFVAGAAIAIPGAHPMGPLPELKDVAVFPIQGWSPGLPLATGEVEPGDPVWLLAKVKSGKETAVLLHRAVVGRSQGFLAYRFDDQTIGLDQTSGGAVLNRNGEVVGLNVGYGRLANGSLIGVADALDTLQTVVSRLP